MFFFFFSSRRRHTRFDCDWSSDVCSSDLVERGPAVDLFRTEDRYRGNESLEIDRKSTRLNSSHSQISYGVFCLKKKNARFSRRRLYGNRIQLLTRTDPALDR